MIRITCFVLIGLSVLAPGALGQSTSYAVERIPLPAGAWTFGSGAITDGGRVAFEAFWPPPVGGPQVSPESIAFLWDGSALLQLERPPGAVYVSVQELGSGGRVVGGLRNANYEFITGCTWLRDGTARVLRPLTGQRCLASDGNGTDRIVGSAYDPVLQLSRPVQWQNGILAPLPTPAPLMQGWCHAINEAGSILGAGHSTGDVQPWLRSPLGTSMLLGLPPGALTCELQDLNAAGDAVGAAYFPAGGGSPAGQHAVRWQQGAYFDFGYLPNTYTTNLFALNRVGTAVGTAGYFGGAQRGLIAEGPQLSLLQDRLDPASAHWSILGAMDIANDGWILAEGVDPAIPPAFVSDLVILRPLP